MDRIVSPDRHLCGCPPFGDYAGQVELVAPPQLRREDGRGVCVDVCLALEVARLWARGIRTTGCCCGHGLKEGYIGVAHEDVGAMVALGYARHRNPGRPEAADSFTPFWPDAPP